MIKGKNPITVHRAVAANVGRPLYPRDCQRGVNRYATMAHFRQYGDRARIGLNEAKLYTVLSILERKLMISDGVVRRALKNDQPPHLLALRDLMGVLNSRRFRAFEDLDMSVWRQLIARINARHKLTDPLVVVPSYSARNEGKYSVPIDNHTLMLASERIEGPSRLSLQEVTITPNPTDAAAALEATRRDWF